MVNTQIVEAVRPGGLPVYSEIARLMSFEYCRKKKHAKVALY